MEPTLRASHRRVSESPSSFQSQIADSAKITALRDLDLIESRAPEALDRLTGLAARLLGVPVSLVTLVGSESQVLLGRYGLP